MRFIDVFYAVALAILLGWLVVGSVGESQRPEERVASGSAASGLPAIGAASQRPWPAAWATVDERNFRILVSGDLDVWGVAVSEDD